MTTYLSQISKYSDVQALAVSWKCLRNTSMAKCCSLTLGLMAISSVYQVITTPQVKRVHFTRLTECRNPEMARLNVNFNFMVYYQNSESDY